jgi:hypothetical protein
VPSLRHEGVGWVVKRYGRAPGAGITVSGHVESPKPRQCPGCGGVFDDVDGPTHPYMVSSPACWASFGALQADELTRFGYPPSHGLVVDAYAASHGGDGRERRDRQSVCIHLMAICFVLERDGHPGARTALLRRATVRKVDWPRLGRPAGAPALTHTHLRDAPDSDAYGLRAREWAAAVWELWAPEQTRIRALLDAHGQ